MDRCCIQNSLQSSIFLPKTDCLDHHKCHSQGLLGLLFLRFSLFSFLFSSLLPSLSFFLSLLLLLCLYLVTKHCVVWQMAKQVNSKVPSLACKPSVATSGLKLRQASCLLRLFPFLFPFFFFFFPLVYSFVCVCVFFSCVLFCFVVVVVHPPGNKSQLSGSGSI